MSMSQISSLVDRSTALARSTFFRFPATLLASFAMTVIFLIISRDFDIFEMSSPLMRVALVLIYFVMVSVVVTLLSESWKLSKKWKWILMVAAAIDALGYYFLFPANLEVASAFHIMRWMVIVLGVFVLTFVAGHIRKKATPETFWTFLWELISRLVVTIFFGFVLWAGLSLAVLAFDFLF